MLTRMEQEKLSFEECLKEAQRLGYAEADPSFDIEGHDTAQKLAILASLAFGTKRRSGRDLCRGHLLDHAPPISRPPTSSAIASSSLASRCKTEQGIEQRVHPTMVPKDSAIAQVMGVTNAVTIDAEGIAPITLVGPGAGGLATASAVVSDIADIARGVRTAPFGRPLGQARRQQQGADAAPRGRLLHPPAGAWTSRAPPRPSPSGLRSSTFRSNRSCSATAAARRAATIRRVRAPVPVILITYATTEDAVRKALAAVERDKVISGKPQLIRIEKN